MVEDDGDEPPAATNLLYGLDDLRVEWLLLRTSFLLAAELRGSFSKATTVALCVARFPTLFRGVLGKLAVLHEMHRTALPARGWGCLTVG